MYFTKQHHDGFAEIMELVETAGPLNSLDFIQGIELARTVLPDREKRMLDAPLAVFRFLARNFHSDIRPRDLPPGIGFVAVAATKMAMEGSRSLLIDDEEAAKP